MPWPPWLSWRPRQQCALAERPRHAWWRNLADRIVRPEQLVRSMRGAGFCGLMAVAAAFTPWPSSHQSIVPAVPFQLRLHDDAADCFPRRIDFVSAAHRSHAALQIKASPVRLRAAMRSSRAANTGKGKQGGSASASAMSDATGSDQPQPAAAAAASPAASLSRPRRSAAQQAQIKLMQQVREKEQWRVIGGCCG